ncbi:MAG: nucleoside-diphosphate sugar epimerase/dehydratase [Pelolinea sp.]|nr:nucleoside-diphosphate sugar epimerase/dehydratase [Pelolinea sp.]
MKNKFNIRNRYVLIGDAILVVVSVLSAYILRLELVEVFSNYYLSLLWMLGLTLLIKLVVYYFFGLYRRMWIYASMKELQLVLVAVTIASALVSAFMLVLFANRFFISFPRSVLIIDWIQSIIFVGGLRYGLRMFAEGWNKFSGNGKISPQKTALIIGAGDAGALVAKELLKNPQLNLKPIGFLDDNPDKFKQQIHGVPVIGKLKDISKTIDSKVINEVIIAIPSAPGSIVRSVSDSCHRNHIPFRTMPGLYELLGGKVSVSRLREVDIADLLRRELTDIDDQAVGKILKGKTVLVTGAGGSIGTELCRQIARWKPSELVLLGHGENSIFETYLEIKENFPELKLSASIADIRDGNRIEQEFSRYKPQVVFHAAAHKHVPLMENNVEDCILNNVLGTQHIINSCLKHDVERLVLISTDKAIRPVSVMGASKRLAEMLVLDAAAKTDMPYSVVRFGNVLGSRGSVVPLFKRQIAHGGPVTVTHPKMKRYFMTIPEAVHLVLQAAGIGKGGETFILNMGQQIKIVDLAEDLIKLSGLEPGKDIDIVFTGIRNGEKLSEDLWNDGRQFNQTKHPDIYSEEGQEELRGDALNLAVKDLVDLANAGAKEKIISQLNKIIPNAEIKKSIINDILKIN